MDTVLEQQEIQPFPRWEGEDRRRARLEWLEAERRVMDPPCEQDHPEEFGPN